MEEQKKQAQVPAEEFNKGSAGTVGSFQTPVRWDNYVILYLRGFVFLSKKISLFWCLFGEKNKLLSLNPRL